MNSLNNHINQAWVIEDSRESLQDFAAFLQNNDFHIMTTQLDNDTAGRLADQSDHPDVIFLDAILSNPPEQPPGLPLLRTIQANPKFKYIPIIFVNAGNANANTNLSICMNLGASDLIHAPYNQTETLPRIRSRVNDAAEKQKLEEEITNRDLFLSLISHDISNVLNNIGNGCFLMHDAIEELSKTDIRMIVGEIKYKIADSMDMLGRYIRWMQRRKYAEIIPEPIDLNHIFINELRELYVLAEKKNIHLSFFSNDGHVYADPDIICTVIRNMISNAIKFTQPGGKVSVSARPTDGGVEIEVTDTGMGMTEKEMNQMLRRNCVKPKKGTFGESGFGIGLNLCRELIEKHNGNLSVSSSPNKGSTFRFTLNGHAGN